MSTREAGTTVGTLIDLSMQIEPHWRFSAAFDHREIVSEGQPFFSTDLRIAAHAFTHVDAPSHVRPDAAPLGEVDVSRLWGPASVIDVSGCGDDVAVTADDLERGGAHVESGDIVVLRSNHELRHATTTPEYWTLSPWVAASAAEWLIAHGVRAIGFDFPQDKATRSPYLEEYHRHEAGLDEDWACHHLMLEIGIPQIEYLTNTAALPPRFTLYALPLNIPTSDGAPVRAFATVD